MSQGHKRRGHLLAVIVIVLVLFVGVSCADISVAVVILTAILIMISRRWVRAPADRAVVVTAIWVTEVISVGNIIIVVVVILSAITTAILVVVSRRLIRDPACLTLRTAVNIIIDAIVVLVGLLSRTVFTTIAIEVISSLGLKSSLDFP